MRGIRTLFVAILVLIGSIVASAQVTVFVRAGGANVNDGLTEATAKATIGGVDGALTVAGVTTLDIGPGNFAGATFTMPLTVNGANAGATMAAWGAATTLTSPITLGAADADVVFDGVVFGAGSTINGASAGANVIVSNCKFLRANTIATAGLGWDELSISGCRFDGNDGGAAITTAVSASGLATFFMTENEIRDYAGTAVAISGSIADAVVTSNEFTANNTGGSSSSAALTFDATSLTGSARFANNLFSDATTTNGIIVSGTLAGKTITIESNLFAGLSGYAISNTGTGMLSAGCNSYGNAPSTATLMSYLNGAIQAGPYISSNADANGAGIGFVPSGACSSDGPVTISGSTNSYFRIQDGVTAVAAGGTVTAGLFTFNESVTVGKSLTIQSTNTNPYDFLGAPTWRTSTWTTINGTVTVSIAATNFTLNGIKVTSSTATTLVTSSATGQTNINNCMLTVNPTAPLTSVPTSGAISILKNGDLTISNTRVTRPTTGGSSPFIRALTFGPGNACRNATIGGTFSEFDGTLQFSGMSLLANVDITNTRINDAGIDGVSFTGNLINTLSITNTDILNSRQNGIGIRDRVTVGNTSASISNCEITGSGKSGSGYAGINIGSLTSGTQSFTGNILAPQDGSNKPFINSRSSYNPTATCNWWGSKSQDVIEASVTGGLVLDDGTSGWRRATSNTGGAGANFDGAATCTVRAFTITLAPSNATCNGSSTGSIVNTLAGTTTGAAYTWSNGPTTKDLTNIAAGTYSVSVTTTSENTRSKSATILEPTVLSGSSAKVNISCNGSNNGSITISNAAGGLIPGVITSQTYTYRIDRVGETVGDAGPQASGSFSSLPPGTYDLYVIASGVSPTCEKKIGSETIYEPTTVTASLASTNISCSAATDGSITVSSTAGGTHTEAGAPRSYEYSLKVGGTATIARA
ncbi:MAG: beta strand repeat-containing protein, partial [Candidatus Kapaibacterium sp.]